MLYYQFINQFYPIPMRTTKQTDGHTVIVSGPVKNDMKIMLQDVKQLEAQIQRLRQFLKKNILRNPALPADKTQQRLLRTIVHRHAPSLGKLPELVRRDQPHAIKKVF